MKEIGFNYEKRRKKALLIERSDIHIWGRLNDLGKRSKI
jgi:hypothetical protein